MPLAPFVGASLKRKTAVAASIVLLCFEPYHVPRGDIEGIWENSGFAVALKRGARTDRIALIVTREGKRKNEAAECQFRVCLVWSLDV